MMVRNLLLIEIIKDDFEEAYGRMILKLLEKYDKYGRSYTTNTDISFYLNRLKEEIEEFEKSPCLEEALDIANFGIMLVYLLQPKGEMNDVD